MSVDSGILARMKAPRVALFVSLFTTLVALASGCGGSRYSYARQYETADGENAYLTRSVDAAYEDVRRARPEDQPYVGWFAVVTSAPEVSGGVARMRMSLRTHQERHLCRTEYADSCRVTVTERELGTFTAQIPVRAEDMREDQTRLGPGSLLRIYGRSTGEQDASGDPVIVAEWYRHWPRFTFVTTASAGSMRR
jgi:hypothetical protein